MNKRTSEGSRKKDIQYHYDLVNDFFALWLDETMSYSCAYFHSPEDTLRQAQLQKIDHVLKKLQLKPGETLLDIGSGWGWLIIMAAQKYQVKALGITLSEEQYQKTKERVAKLGLEHLVDVELLDYRELIAGGRTFDKVASVGMLEHVGQANLGHYMATVRKLLNPGGYVPSLRELVWLLPEHGLHLLDIESLRMHYAMTLDRWAEGYERNIDRVRKEQGESAADRTAT